MHSRPVRRSSSSPRIAVLASWLAAAASVALGWVAPTHAATITWDGGGGTLNWLTPANWSGDVLPGPGDDVIIDAAGSVTITLAGSASINSLSCADALSVTSNGTLTLASSASVGGLLTLANGKLAGGSWTPLAGLTVANQNSALLGVVLNGDLTCPASTTLTVQNGLTLNGTITLTGANPRLVMSGTQAITGDATIRLTGSASNPAQLHVEGTSVVTLEPTVLVEGGWATLGTSLQTPGVSTIINDGTIRSITGGAPTIISGEQFLNNGTVEATAGSLSLASSVSTVNDGIVRAVTTGSIVLAGPIAAADLGDIRNISGSLLVQTAINLLGGTLTLDAFTGIWTFNGGGLTDGTLAITNGFSPLFTTANSTFSAMTVNGNLALGTNHRLWLTNGLTLNGTLAMTGANPYLVANGTQTIDGNATIQLDGSSNSPARIAVEGNATLTLAPSVLIEGGWGSIGLNLQTAGTSTVINQGTIRCDTSGANFDLVGEIFVNEGAIESTAGTLRMAPSSTWSNSGTMTSLGGTLRLEGSTTLASFAGISNQGGSLQTVMNLDFLGESLTISEATGPFTFAGGTWSNGTLTIEPGAAVGFTSANTVFSGMTVNGNLALGTNQRLWLTNGLTLNGTIAMTGSNPYLIANGTQTLGGNAVIQLDGTTNNPARITVEGTSTLTIAPTVLIEGGWASIGQSFQTAGVSGIVHQGTIRCDTTNATFDLTGESLVNNGTIEVTAGTLAVNHTQSCTNAGLIRSNGGTLSLVGAFSLASLGDVRNVAGTLLVKSAIALNGGTLTLNGTTGVWTFDGGSLTAGTLVPQAGAMPLFTGANTVFNGMTVNGNLALGTTQRLWFANGLTLNGTIAMTGSNPYLIASGTQTLGGNAVIQLDGTTNNPARITVEGTSTLTIAPTVLIEGGWASIGQSLQTAGVSGIVHQGTIRCDTANTTFDLTGESLVNNGTIEVTAGTLAVNHTQSCTNAGLIRSNGGTLSLVGAFSLASLGDVRNVAGTLLVKSAIALNGGTLTLNGTTGVWTFDGGSLTAGTLVPQAGAMPLFTGANTVFSGMTVNGNLALSTNHRLWIANGLTLNGTLAMAGSNPYLVVNGTQTLGGNAVIQLDGNTNNPARIAVEGTSALTIAPSVLIEGGWADIGAVLLTAGASSITNNGVLRADTPAATFRVTVPVGDTFTNNGTVETTNGNTLVVDSATNLDQTGTLTGGVWKANNATLRFGTGAAGTPIRTLAAECVLTSTNGKILDLAKLEAITTSGVLRLNGGALLTVVPATGTLVDDGFLFISGTSKLTVTGGFTHGATAILTAATGAANQIMVDASGALTLDGFLQVSNGPGYTPIVGDQIVIADGASRSGVFTTVTTCAFADLFYSPTQVIYVYGEDTGVFADLNGDGFVGPADLALLLGSWGVCADLCCNADLDASGDVGAPDIALLLGGWG
jgi:lipopolysaccharide export system protein LptA